MCWGNKEAIKETKELELKKKGVKVGQWNINSTTGKEKVLEYEFEEMWLEILAKREIMLVCDGFTVVIFSYVNFNVFMNVYM